ncbi:MAG: hypothetical protein ABIX37_10210 [Gammaproteobacteria bacterium]
MAGAAGALAWELAARTLILLGVPVVDMVKTIGTLAAPAGPAWLWWPAGLAVHLTVGVIGAIFYAYFVWARLTWKPVFQGLTFGVVAALPVIFAVYPLLLVMHSTATVVHMNLMSYTDMISGAQRVELVLGHAIYGAVLGALYTRPVGRSTRTLPDLDADINRRPRGPPAPALPPVPANGFMFASGIECSYPTLENGRWRLDQMEATGHYRNWREDLALTVETGVTFLRYGPPLHLVCIGPGQYDWSFMDVVMPEFQRLGLTPIIDLCHFGVSDWLGDFQNPEFPTAMRDYSRAFGERYPWVRYYTPINEMYVCAKLSALEGLWNEQRRDERSFMTAVRHMARANVLIMQTLLELRPDAVFINSESGECYQACCPDPEIARRAEFENERRFLALDLIYAHPLTDFMKKHAYENGLPPEEYDWFMAQKTPRRAVLGVDYYLWNEKLINSRGDAEALGELFGWFVIAQQYYERYRLPLMHTETNIMDARKGPHWLWRQWHNVKLIQKAGVPVVGFTWYSVTDQVDWDIAQSRPLGTINPVGLFDLNRDPRPVGQAYKHLIRTFKEDPWIKDCPSIKALLA